MLYSRKFTSEKSQGHFLPGKELVMTATVKNMTTGKPVSLIISFSLPLMIGNVFQQLYTVVDTMVVGKALGVNALAALGSAEWLNWLMLGIIQGLTQGFAILMAQEFGAENMEDLRKVVGSSILLSAFSALFLLICGQILVRPMLELLQTPAEIIDNTLLYLRYMYLGVPIVMAYNLLASILRALGDGKTPLYAMIVAAFTNIFLDLLFVLVFHWGIAGAAVATLIAQMISSIYCFLHIRKIDILTLKRSHFKIDFQRSKKLFLLGTPMAFQNAIIAVGGMIVQSVVNTFGVIFIAGFTATNKLYGILEVAATSYGYSMVTYTGQNLGAGKIGRIRKGIRSANIVAVITSLVIATFMLILGKFILGLFISGTPQETAQALDVGYFYLAIMSIFLPVLYILHVTRSVIQGMGNTLLPMVSGIAEFIMRTLTSYLLPLIVGQTGIFFAEIMAWIGADVILITSYFVTIRKVEKSLSNK